MVSLYLFFVIIILYSVLLIWISGRVMGGAEVGGVFPSIVDPAPVRPGSESGVLLFER